MRLGIDIGSTTVKVVILDDKDNIIYKRYERHMSNVLSKVREILSDIKNIYDDKFKIVITGSGGLAISKVIGVAFQQEVITCTHAVSKFIPQTKVVIELGGEDAKITFLGDTVEQQMNGSCAGGTGAFIDQMAVLLNTDAIGLNERAKDYNIIYPIAARCGVFAKTDIQPLINEGANIEDLSASIFQAVVNQTISGLACGRKIAGNVAFLGGPLTFLSELKKRFIDTLHLGEDEIVDVFDGEYFVAMGASLLASKEEKSHRIGDIIEKIDNISNEDMSDSNYMEPLFSSEKEYEEFKERHSKAKVDRILLKDVKGAVYLGIDAGSTTTKAVLIDKDKRVAFEYYESNEGKPLDVVKKILEKIYDEMNKDTHIECGVVTGYGEMLIKKAFQLDFGEIETIAHYKGAENFLKNVDFILDIGGQDMKCMRIKNGAIYNIMLNEACSSGCGSFIETYAKSVDMSTVEFASEAIKASRPVDLGTRCTVFMNSKVKQAQKEGASIGDISAGLSYSVIKNAIYKVIKLRDLSKTGENVVVQGGTFLNDAVLKSTENILGRQVIRPDISGLMGAFGASLIALEKAEYIKSITGEEKLESKVIKRENLDKFEFTTDHFRCGLCENNCLCTINRFNNGEKFITGNRCEKGSGTKVEQDDELDLYDYKFKRLFSYKPLNEGRLGKIGIPRALNIYENYPFWFTFFTELGYQVEISDITTKATYELGMDTIPSDTVCYPAKLVHGHIKNLIDKGIKRIFYPNINYERVEDKEAPNNFNCPVVATYPELIKNNMDDVFLENEVDFISPFLPYDDDKKLEKSLYELFKNDGVSKKDVKNAIEKGRTEENIFKDDIRNKADELLKRGIKENKKAIVLAGRPYHLDPEINHGINKLISSFGMIVLTEDSVAHLGELERPIRVLDQWMYHSRLYKASEFVSRRDDVELIQLNSFGCGLDAVTTDEVEDILNRRNKLYTVLKIDEGNNLGSVKIRIRSLKAAIEEREKNKTKPIEATTTWETVEFTKDMRKDYTILIPQMSPIHFQFFEVALNNVGLKAKMLPAVNEKAIDEGLKYINNDACYPTMVALGQIIAQLKSGEEDLDKTAIFMSQTGGGCRASNYIAFLRKALKDLNLEHIPIISVNPGHLEKNSGFKLTFGLMKRMVFSILYGDLMMVLMFRMRPYEVNKGQTNELYEKWTEIASENIKNGSLRQFQKNMVNMIKEFDKIPVFEELRKPRVGVVGEILVKYHPTANNDIVSIIEEEGGEAVVLDLIDFFTSCMYSEEFNYKELSGTFKNMSLNNIGLKVLDYIRKPINETLLKSKHFHPPAHISETAKKAEKVCSLGNQCGEGWLLTGEMVELLEMGVNNILCLQPFACLPNHITGKGMIKSLKKQYKNANIATIDYDPGASETNQLNRIKLLMSTAHKNLEKTLN